MKPLPVLTLAILGLSLLCCPRSGLAAGTVTLTSNYPAPAGNYAKLSVGTTYTTTGVPGDRLIVEGNVGIGTSNPTDKLFVTGNVTITGDTLRLGGSNANFLYDPSGAGDFYIRQQGNLYVKNIDSLFYRTVFALAFTTSSDRRLKEKIQPIIDALKKIKAMNGVTFAFKQDPKTVRMGLIAQDVEPIVPEVVSIDNKGMRGINYDGLVGLLVEGIKDQQKQIDVLTARLDKLEKKQGQKMCKIDKKTGTKPVHQAEKTTAPAASNMK